MSHPQILRDMVLFVEVARRKSFSQAAVALGMPISSLSRRITLFESAIGLRLLDRTTRKLILTSYGEAYLAQVTSLVEDAQRTFDDMISEAKGASGFLKIAVPPDLWVLQHLSGVIAEFTRANEHVHVHANIEPAAVDLASGNYDLAIATREPRETSLIVRKVGELQNGLFASPAYLDAHGRPQHPHHLKDHTVILPSQCERATWTLSDGDGSVKVEVSCQVSCNSASLARRFAEIDRGIIAAATMDVARDVLMGRLEHVLPHYWLPPSPVYIVTTSRLLSVKTRSFIDFTVKRLGTILNLASENKIRAQGSMDVAERNVVTLNPAPTRQSS